jgi:hypothetical protein
MGVWVVVMAVLAAAWPGLVAPAAAQTAEVVGTRALGMGGAFVAVADDPSAVYWNPAGLPRMGIIQMGLEWQSFETGPDAPTFRDPAADGSSTLVAMTTPPLGVSYLRLRQTSKAGGGLTTSLITHHVGASLVQSIGERIDVATTIRFVHGEAAVGDLPGKGSNTADFDLAAMVMLGRGVRAGVIVRNVLEPEFDTAALSIAVPLERQARAGVAWHGESSTVAVDVDLLETESVLGPRRHVAIGGEQWFANRRVAARAGFRLNTTENALPAGAAGVTVRLTASIFADAQVTRGASDRDRGWGISLRYAY